MLQRASNTLQRVTIVLVFWIFDEFSSELGHSGLEVGHVSGSGKRTSPKLVFHDPEIPLWGAKVALWKSKGVPFNVGRV